MGFDVYGLRAKSEKGEYFRNNIWWWRPLATYVLTRVTIPEHDEQQWQMNGGYEVSGSSALLIAEKLDELIAKGETATYAKEYANWQADLPLVLCYICKGAGKRLDAVVEAQCNACQGKGKVKNWATNYPFDIENVEEFAKFCRESGGFEIW